MTGAVMPAGRGHGRDPGSGAEATASASPCRAGQKTGAERALCRRGPEGRRAGAAARASCCAPADIGLIASLGIGEVKVKRRLRVAFFSTGDELASIGAPLKEGEVYDSNRYTLHGMLARLGVEIIDMGVVRDDPAALEKAFRSRREDADVIITTGGVSVGEADFVKQLMAKLGEVLFWKIAMRPGRPMAFGKIGERLPLRPARQPGRGDGDLLPVRARRAAHLSGRTRRRALPLLKARQRADNLRKVPGRTEYQRGVLFRGRRRVEGAHHRPAGLGRAALDVGGELLHRARARARRGQGRRAGAACSSSRAWRESRSTRRSRALATAAKEMPDRGLRRGPARSVEGAGVAAGPSTASATPARYMRHVLYVDPHDDFVITAITWLPGQVSPVHGHQVWCAYGVAEGELDRGAVPRIVRQARRRWADQDLPRGRGRGARPRLQDDPPRVEPQPRHASSRCTSTASAPIA